METINVYAINVNPCTPDKGSIQETANIVATVFNNYKEIYNKSCKFGEVEIVSFRPYQDSTYTSFVEDYIYTIAKKPCIIIFKSILDISNVSKTAGGRLKNFITHKGVRAVYFSDYSMLTPANKYFSELIKVFQIPVNENLRESRREKSNHSEKIKQEVRRLRLLDDPVKYSEIERIANISDSTLRGFVSPRNNHGTRGPSGRDITPEETDKINSIMDEIKDDILGTVHIYYRKCRKETEK